MTFPECLTKTFEELRKPKIETWNRNKENSRAWLALNMMAEARAGFRAFNEGPRDNREIDFVALRQALARGAPWTPELVESLIPRAADTGGMTTPLRVWLEQEGRCCACASRGRRRTSSMRP